MNKEAKLRIGIIGAGWWAADYHIPGILAQPAAELAAVCDPDPERLGNVVRAFPVLKTFPDYRAMLDQEALDGVIVVTPHATHYPIACDCLERGLHVLVEKPLTLKAIEARRLVELAQEKNRQLMIGYTYHFYTHIQRARQAVQGGELGEIQYVNSSFSSNVLAFLSARITTENTPVKYSINPPGDNYNNPARPGGSGEGHLQLTHSIGAMFYVTGLRARQVQAVMHNHELAVDLVDAFSVVFENGALGVVGGTGNAGSNHRMALAVYGTGGCYLSDSLARFAALRRFDGVQETLDINASAGPRYAVDHNFIEAILGRAENHAPGEIGWRAVELLDAAYRSAQRQGQPVSIEELYT